MALQGARDTIYQTTDADGHIDFGELAPGVWTVHLISADIPENHNIEVDQFQITVGPGEHRAVEFRVDSPSPPGEVDWARSASGHQNASRPDNGAANGGARLIQRRRRGATRRPSPPASAASPPQGGAFVGAAATRHRRNRSGQSATPGPRIDVACAASHVGRRSWRAATPPSPRPQTADGAIARFDERRRAGPNKSVRGESGGVTIGGAV